METLTVSEEEIVAEEREAGADAVDEAARVRAVLRPAAIPEASPMPAPQAETTGRQPPGGFPGSRLRLGPTRIVIADDHPIFRDGLRRLLEGEPHQKVLGEASDGAEAVKLARQLKPDILLLDLAMPKHPGLEAQRELSTPANTTPVRVILLTAAIEKDQIVEALQLGARAVVLKDSATRVLLRAIETVIAGEYWVHREQVSNLVQYLRTLMESTQEEGRRRKFGLTARELEIVSAVVAGCRTKEIAQHFKISENTVKHHLRHIFDKIEVSTRLELALFAVNHRLPLVDIRLAVF